jgi:hypothetical protein
VGCNSYNNSNNSTYTDRSSQNCLQAAASRIYSQRKADEAAATKLLVQLQKRTNDDHDDYSNIDLIDRHPALVPMMPAYQPLPEWREHNINIPPYLAIVGLRKDLRTHTPKDCQRRWPTCLSLSRILEKDQSSQLRKHSLHGIVRHTWQIGHERCYQRS